MVLSLMPCSFRALRCWRYNSSNRFCSDLFMLNSLTNAPRLGVVQGLHNMNGVFCREAASFNNTLQATLDPLPTFAAAKAAIASNAPERGRYMPKRESFK